MSEGRRWELTFMAMLFAPLLAWLILSTALVLMGSAL